MISLTSFFHIPGKRSVGDKNIYIRDFEGLIIIRLADLGMVHEKNGFARIPVHGPFDRHIHGGQCIDSVFQGNATGGGKVKVCKPTVDKTGSIVSAYTPVSGVVFPAGALNCDLILPGQDSERGDAVGQYGQRQVGIQHLCHDIAGAACVNKEVLVAGQER